MKKRIYDQWAGNPKGRAEDTTKCIESVSDSTGWHSCQCSRKRGYGLDGLYCKQHAKKHKERLDRLESVVVLSSK